MANFEAFRWNISLSENLLFMKSVLIVNSGGYPKPGVQVPILPLVKTTDACLTENGRCLTVCFLKASSVDYHSLKNTYKLLV